MMKFFVLAASVAAANTAVTSATVTLGSYEAGTESVNTVAFTTVVALVAGDTITITYPAGYTVPTQAAEGIASTGFTGAAATGDTALKAAVDKTGIIVTITLPVGVTAAATTALTVQLTKVKNPTTPGAADINIKTTRDLTDAPASVTITSSITGTLADTKPCKTEDQTLEVAEKICLPTSECKGNPLKCAPKNGAFSYGFTMLAVLAAFVL